MDQVFIDNFISKLNEVVKQLSLIAANTTTKGSEQSVGSIITRNDQQQTEDNAAKQGELVSIDDSSAKKLADKLNEGIAKTIKDSSDKDNKQKLENDKKMLSNLDNISKSAADSKKIQEDQLQKQDVEVLTKKEAKNHVYIAGIDKSVAEELIAGFNKTKPKEESSGLLSSLGSLLGPLGLMLGGGLLALSGPGGAGGIGKIMLKLGEQMLKKAASRVIAIVKNIFGRGFKALKSIVDDVLKASSSLLDNFPKNFKDAFAKIRDAIFDGLEGVLKFSGDIIKKIPGTNMIMDFLKGMGEKFGKILSKGLKIFKAVPILGDIVNIYFAYEKFQDGDTFGSLLELAGAIPGFGIIADFYSIYRDFTYTEEEKKQQNTSFGDFFGSIGKQFSKVWENIKKLPFIQGCMDIIEGNKKIFAGDISNGLQLIGKGAYKMTPLGTIFNSVASVYDWLTSMFSSDEQQATAASGESVESILPEKFDLIKMLKDAVVAKIKSMTSLVKTIVSKPVEWAKSLWTSVASYFSSDDDAKAAADADVAIKQHADVENLPKPKSITTFSNQALGVASDNTLKNLFDDLKKAQIDKADLQVRKIETTNKLLESIIIIMKEFNVDRAGAANASATNKIFALQSSGPSMLANARNAGYPI